MQSEYDEGGSIGKRYRRQDEIGTPFCVTVDHQSLEDGTVTLRDRDTLEQERVPIDGLADDLAARLARAWRSPKVATADASSAAAPLQTCPGRPVAGVHSRRPDPEVRRCPCRACSPSRAVDVAVPAVANAQSVDLRRKISVNGQSSALVANDAARLTLGVAATRPTARGALDAASRQMQRVIGAVKAGGVAAADIRTQTISVSRLVTRLKGGRTRSRGYRAIQSIRVVVRAIDRRA